VSRLAAIGAAVAMILAAGPASAEGDPGSPAGPAAPPVAEGDPGGQWIQLDNGDWMLLEDSEVIEVFAERETKPFDRDTELRLTGRDLAARGVTNLAEALDQIPELHIRQLGRGGEQVNIRGARKAAVKVLIDGVPVDEVFYGTFDLSTIPVTDIAQIRVSMSPSSPIDGLGGPGGVIEVHTIDAAGARLLVVRGHASSLPSAELATTARSELGAGFAVRGSATATLGMRDYDVLGSQGMASVDEDRAGASGSLRLEYRRGRDRFVADAFAQQRRMLIPPGEDGSEDIIVVDGETSTRLGLGGDLERRGWRFQGRGYAQTLDRDSSRHRDAAMEEPGRREQLTGVRAGVATLANRPVGATHLLGSATLDTETGDLVAGSVTTSGRATLGELAAGVQTELAGIQIHGAAGIAAPLGDGGDAPWPEAKLALAYRVAAPLGLRLTLARKGRLPTLRERFRPDIGNPDLEPELASFAEIETTLAAGALEVRYAGWLRDTDGMIRFDGDLSRLINVDDLILRGFDVSASVLAHRGVRVGAAYSFTDAYSPTFGSEPLDFLAHHRADGWVAVEVGRVRGRLRVRHISEQNDQSVTIPARTTADISALARIRPGLEASLRIDDVAGDPYLLRRGGVMSPGRVVMLGLERRLGAGD
jgi:hypothetical protein